MDLSSQLDAGSSVRPSLDPLVSVDLMKWKDGLDQSNDPFVVDTIIPIDHDRDPIHDLDLEVDMDPVSIVDKVDLTNIALEMIINVSHSISFSVLIQQNKNPSKQIKIFNNPYFSDLN